MQQIRNSLNSAPNRLRPTDRSGLAGAAGQGGEHVRRLVFEASRRAEAMGLVEPDASSRDAGPALHLLTSRVRRAGIAAAAADRLSRVEVSNVETPNAAEVVALLETLIAALEASPVPKFEWAGLGRVFAPDDLASLINVSVSSLKRYVSGERETPDDVAARLHFLALVVGDLAGSYNHIGIRRWFQRKRTRLAGRTPAAILKGRWDPDEEAPRQIRQIATELVSLSAT